MKWCNDDIKYNLRGLLNTLTTSQDRQSQASAGKFRGKCFQWVKDLVSCIGLPQWIVSYKLESLCASMLSKRKTETGVKRSKLVVQRPFKHSLQLRKRVCTIDLFSAEGGLNNESWSRWRYNVYHSPISESLLVDQWESSRLTMEHTHTHSNWGSVQISQWLSFQKVFPRAAHESTRGVWPTIEPHKRGPEQAAAARGLGH